MADDIDILDGLTMEEKSDFLEFQKRVEGTNINRNTLLATDYLNHFNEIVMTLDMIPMMPELLEEAKAWKPKTYAEHFRDSTFSDRELAIEAYKHVPKKFRIAFERTITQMAHIVAAAISRVEKELEAGNPGPLQESVSAATQMLQKLTDHASAIIHGSEKTMDQSAIDNFLG
ncbi:MAG: hypothetical protein H7841_06800 [Magnetospirillum sp. WYHS-4]